MQRHHVAGLAPADELHERGVLLTLTSPTRQDDVPLLHAGLVGPVPWDDQGGDDAGTLSSFACSACFFVGLRMDTPTQGFSPAFGSSAMADSPTQTPS